jgi:hypothetical protein
MIMHIKFLRFGSDLQCLKLLYNMVVQIVDYIFIEKIVFFEHQYSPL